MALSLMQQLHAKLLIAVGRGTQRRALCCCNVKCDARARQLARSSINAKRNSREATDSAAEGTSHAMSRCSNPNLRFTNLNLL